MKAKLIKKDDHYFLEVEPYTLSNLQRHTIIANTFDKPKGHILQLSLKNCQAIERGYDLEELAENCADQYADRFDYNDGHGNMEVYSNRDEIEKVYTIAFQKALELMGDKKFSEEDIHEAYSLGEAEDRFGFHDFLQQNNQTEWDVIVEMEDIQEIHIDGVLTLQPKLDVDSCLILKRI
jgi:hypothetical protein